jgi:phage baseplate assembly protein W
MADITAALNKYEPRALLLAVHIADDNDKGIALMSVKIAVRNATQGS